MDKVEVVALELSKGDIQHNSHGKAESADANRTSQVEPVDTRKTVVGTAFALLARRYARSTVHKACSIVAADSSGLNWDKFRSTRDTLICTDAELTPFRTGNTDVILKVESVITRIALLSI